MTETVSSYVKRTRQVSSNTPKTEDLYHTSHNTKFKMVNTNQDITKIQTSTYCKVFILTEWNQHPANKLTKCQYQQYFTKTIHFIKQTTKNSSRGLTTWLSETQYSHRLPLSCRVHSSEWNNYLRKSLLNSVKCYSKTYFGATCLKQCE